MVEKVLEKPQWPAEWPYTEQDFTRMDESDDAIFYEPSRLVYHIDDPCVAALTKYYKQHIRDGDDVLDICSSWVSHYPKDWKGGRVVGLGMNEYELSQNPQLTEYVVQDLNKDPTLPFANESFDKVTCVVSIDYLTKPLQVVKEMGRVLRPGGEAIISMSNRCFPTKPFKSGYKRTIWNMFSSLVVSFTTRACLIQPPAKIVHPTQDSVIHSILSKPSAKQRYQRRRKRNSNDSI
jgi:SAM-dependent methyltransferase